MSGARARRKTVKKVDYAKEQEFSDEDIFEDSPGEEPQPTRSGGRKSRGGGGRRSKSSAPDSAIEQPQIVDESGQVHFTEKGYDPSLPPIRERFPFLPEHEEDGSPRIELIVGRRPVADKEDVDGKKGFVGDEEQKEESQKTRGSGGRRGKKGSPQKEINQSGPVEYEYLVKYRGRSYLHLEWKSGADLESMNKSAKGIYRRFLKKLAQGTEDDLENPEFDPSYAVPQRILDEKEQEITVELSDAELLKWEKEREKELAMSDGEDEPGDEDTSRRNRMGQTPQKSEEEKKEKNEASDEGEVDDWGSDEIKFDSIDLAKLRKIIARESPYYPVIEGSTNPYRDGYVKEAPRKPRASYLFFQATMRTYFQKQNPGMSQTELMALMGTTWQALSDTEREPFVQLARDESARYDKERVLMEKAQRPNEVWQPLRRCLMVVDRLATDPFADIFLEPVDTTEFTDYHEVIDSPMDLRTVRERINSRKYQAPEQFARDMRKVWNNCKVYNQHGSAIWHVADYMSKLFERLYHAWVLEFRDRYLRWADPKARPWEITCRMHDGKCGTPDHEMVLCDHCDAMYGFKCLVPPLKKIPSKAWHCPDCRPKLKSIKGARMLSAVAENAARKRAELGDIPKKTVKQTMYLIKWAGLGYEHCTWESKEDVNDDQLVAQYRKLNNRSADESFMSLTTLENILRETKHPNLKKEKKANVQLVGLQSQFHAQARALQFARFGMEPPVRLSSECGAKMYGSARSMTLGDNVLFHPKSVVDCVSDLMTRVERSELSHSSRVNPCLPTPMTGEYDAIIPITSKGLLMNVGEIHGSVAFLGYRQFPGGVKGPSEIKNLVRNVGDKIIAVDGISTVGKSFKDVIAMLRESGKHKYAYMRFLENKFAVCESELASVGPKGSYAIEELRLKFTNDRQRYLLQRIHNSEDSNVDASPGEPGPSEGQTNQNDSKAESDDGSEGEFQPESDDDEEVAEKTPDGAPEKTPSAPDQTSSVPKSEAAVSSTTEPSGSQTYPKVEEKESDAGILMQHESTRSLAFRLLETDLGYSSDEGGDEENAFFLDGVDGTFAKENDVNDLVTAVKERKKPVQTIPAKNVELVGLGEQAKMACAVALAPTEPNPDDFVAYPLKPKKGGGVDEDGEEELQPGSPSKSVKRSTVKVEQVDVTTGDTIHVWANIESAAATLQLRLDQLKQVLIGEYDEELGDEVGGYKWRYAPAGAKVTAGASSARGGGGKKAKEAWLEFREKLYDPSEPHIYKNSNRLRDYQVDGVNWLASTWYKKQSCILADEMGLGKTVQIVSYIEHLFRVEKIARPYLVVVPLSTVEHWRREFEGWTEMVCCVYHDRQRVWRDVMREYEWYYEDRPHTPEFLKFDVLVTTYDTLISDFDVISQIPFRVAVVDEAHRLRNQKGKLLECMREISARGTMQYGFQSRVLISGTPLQNDLTELWTLLNFIEPFKFPDPDDFRNKFGNMSSREHVENLQKMISPYMLRRVKEDVAKDIPAKEETVIDVELTSIQKQYYRAIFEHNHAFLSLGGGRQAGPKLQNIQMELRKVCNHPFLIDGVEQRETEKQFKDFSDNGAFDGKTPEEQQQMLNNHGYVMTSGKMVLMDKLLPKLRTEGHKVLIFSQMVKMLDLLAEYCEFRNFQYERLDGRIRGAERQKAIDRFEREPDSFIFMLSTRAGGVGINLTAADICIIFDSDWNPQNDVQAQARCHRIGQTKEVKIFRLITSRSFEQEMFERASKKLGLEQAVLGTFEKEKEDDKPSQKEMEQLLKKGAYALLEDDNDEITREFCTDDIDAILAKRTRTRVVEGQKTASWLNKQGMMISKSRFAAESGDNALDMEDPLFWQKVMPDFVTPSLILRKLNDLVDDIEGRVRGPGRGRGRKKKGEQAKEEEKVDGKAADDTAEEIENKDDNETHPDGEDEGEAPDDDVDDGEENSKVQLSRTNTRKVHNFMSDLKSMMQGIFDEEDEETLSANEKDVCQKLLLTISVKEKIFTEEQRHEARMFLKRLEGNRRRRCRTSDQSRFTPGKRDESEHVNTIPDELRIAGRKRKTRRKRGEKEEEENGAPETKRRKRISGNYVGDDGYLHHSDSEADWSDVGEDFYGPGMKKKERISRKEARRRRVWGADDDAATAAGRPWPVFPRHVVKKVLSTILDEVMKYDDENGGAFSEPVSKDDFPEYYEQIEKPMDYGTMKKKLENGEYRSAQAMQKDFVLILQNCRKFNATTSDIVKEARKQHMMRADVLKRAAATHNLFLAEDGTVLEIFDDEPGSAKKEKKGKKKAKPTEDAEEDQDVVATPVDPDETESEDDRVPEPPIPKKKKAVKVKKQKDSAPKDAKQNGDGNEVSSTTRKPRIRIKMKSGPVDAIDDSVKKKASVKRKKATDDVDDASETEPSQKKAKKNLEKAKRNPEKSSNAEGGSAAVEKAQKEGTKAKLKRSSFTNLSVWKKKRAALDGSFKASRDLFTSQGSWQLPAMIPNSKFIDVARETLSKAQKVDKYSVFAEAVTEDEAPGYFDIVEQPMDFGTMLGKVESGAYGNGSEGTKALYDDFLLIFDNCLLYNDEEGEIAEEATRVLGHLPECFVSACLSVAKKTK